MNDAQYRLYWREWQACRSWLIEHGREPKAADALRSRLTKDALGYELSMSVYRRWKNPELDKVLAKFRSVSDGGNLDAQMEIEEQPEQRKAALRIRCLEAVRKWICPSVQDDEGALRYLDGVARKIVHAEFAALDERGLQKVCGVVQLHARRIRSRVEEPNPF